MKAMILAAGQGTRVRPLTQRMPKPMIPVLGKPVMEYLVEQLAVHGFNQIMVNISHLADSIEGYFGDGRRWGVEIGYSFEGYLDAGSTIAQPVGSAGGIARIQDFGAFFDDTFLVVCGDALIDLDLTAVLRRHWQSGAVASKPLDVLVRVLEILPPFLARADAVQATELVQTVDEAVDQCLPSHNAAKLTMEQRGRLTPLFRALLRLISTSESPKVLPLVRNYMLKESLGLRPYLLETMPAINDALDEYILLMPEDKARQTALDILKASQQVSESQPNILRVERSVVENVCCRLLRRFCLGRLLCRLGCSSGTCERMARLGRQHLGTSSWVQRRRPHQDASHLKSDSSSEARRSRRVDPRPRPRRRSSRSTRRSQFRRQGRTPVRCRGSSHNGRGSRVCANRPPSGGSRSARYPSGRRCSSPRRSHPPA